MKKSDNKMYKYKQLENVVQKIPQHASDFEYNYMYE